MIKDQIIDVAIRLNEINLLLLKSKSEWSLTTSCLLREQEALEKLMETHYQMLQIVVDELNEKP